MNNDKGTNISYTIPSSSKMRRLLRPLSFPLNWESKYFLTNNETLKKNEKIKEFSENSANINKIQKFKINLLNFRYELKKTKNPKEICEFLTKLNFIDKLITEHLVKAEKYKEFNHEEDLIKDKALLFTESDFFDYYKKSDKQYNILSNFMLKISEKERKFKNLISLKNKTLKKLYKDYSKGIITYQSLIGFKNSIYQSIKEYLVEKDKESEDFYYISKDGDKLKNYKN